MIFSAPFVARVEAASSVQMAPSSMDLIITKQADKVSYESRSISFAVKPSASISQITYKSRNKSVAKVSKKGKVTAKGNGRTKIDVNVTFEKNSKRYTKNFVLKVGVSTKVKSVTNPEFYSISFDKQSPIFLRIKGKSYKNNCTVPVDDLRYIHVLHKDKKGVVKEGEMICNKYIAEDLLEIFEKLYDASYPIERMELVDEYDADDEASMEANNSSSFNFRFISNTKKVSKHGLGMAVDINTLYNPYVKVTNGKTILEPVTAGDYVDRKKSFDYKIEKGDLAYKLFTQHGFEWGGNWNSLKDYQHFEVPTSVLQKLYPDSYPA